MPTARTPPIYTSPQDVAQAFYQAFETRDIDAMMATWAEDEDIVCIHPGGTRHVGYESVRHSFDQLFAGNTKLTFRLEQVVLLETVGLAMQSAIEHLQAGDDGARGAAIATNVLMRTPSGWRVVCHHASPAPPVPDALTRVSMVGNDLALDAGIGTCGKEGQSVPVGVGQPTLRIDALTVGGTS